jgi:hypothetical protein
MKRFFGCLGKDSVNNQALVQAVSGFGLERWFVSEE